MERPFILAAVTPLNRHISPNYHVPFDDFSHDDRSREIEAFGEGASRRRKRDVKRERMCIRM